MSQKRPSQTLLEATNQPFREVFKACPVGMLLVNDAGVVLQANEALLADFGYCESELLGTSVDRLVPETVQARHATFRQAYMRNPEKRPMGQGRDLFGRRADGSAFPVEVALNPIQMAGETLIIISVIDLTFRIKSEQSFRGVFKACPVGMLLVDEAGIVQHANATLLNDFGYLEKDLVGDSVDRLVPDSVRKRHAAFRQSYMTHPETRPMGQGRDLFARRADGTTFPVEVALNPIQIEGRTQVIISVLDLSFRKQAVREIEDLNQNLERRVRQRTEALAEAKHEIEGLYEERDAHARRLEEINSELESFAYSVSHDLRAPLRYIDGFLGLLQDHLGPTLDEEADRLMKTVTRSAQEMSQLIDDLLAFSRMGRQELKWGLCDMQALAEQAIALLDGQRQARKVDIQFCSPLPSVEGDSAMLRLVWENLVGNAIKYSKGQDGGVIEIGAHEAPDAGIRFWVRDNGIGFNPKYAEKIFGVFERLHSSAQYEGTGIGLANVRRILKRHAGRIWAEGEPDRGAVFWFELPRRSET
ncbi:MAG: PAS domain S-box protein [Acidobacteria bacterium]|nr:PAS domain S-box protein [Acidobacteriota bacterium]MCB9397846.1 PAS domain S-box protein [Acidobacteriota bacterium]